MVKNREIETNDQLADPLTKPMGALDNFRSLPTLQGQQPAITQILDMPNADPPDVHLLRHSS